MIDGAGKHHIKCDLCQTNIILTFMKIPPAATKAHREEYGLQNSDGIEELKEDIKRERASMVTVVEPLGKRRQET